MPIRDDDPVRQKAEVEKVNRDMKVAREQADWQDFFAVAGNYPVIPERSTGEGYFTVEELYRFFKERMQFETSKGAKEKALQTK